MPEHDMAAVEKVVYLLRYADQDLDHGEIGKVKNTCWRAQELIRSIIAERDRLQATCDNWEGIAKKLNSEAEEASVENLRLKAENERLSRTADRLARAIAEMLEPSPIKPSLERAEIIGLAMPAKVVNYAKAAMRSYRAALASAPEPSTGSKEPMPVGTIGHLDHGKTALTVAITKILRDKP